MYGVSFVDPASYWYSVSAHVIIYVISYITGPRYNGTLYLQPQHTENEWRMYVSVNCAILDKIMACRLFGSKRLSEDMQAYC